jgi:predicted nucleic acid-binding protein
MTSPRVAVLNPDQGTARHYAEIYAALRAAGSPMPTNDMWIAALTRQHRVSLLTFDSHFAAVPGLDVKTP